MNRTNATAPAINVVENENNYRIEVAAPGLKKEDFTLHIDESNNLVINMEKKSDNKEERKNDHYLRREFTYSKFMQTIMLPENVEKDDICAEVKDGVLEIELPKKAKEDVHKSHKSIEIK
jgi:HSP20 family protein